MDSNSKQLPVRALKPSALLPAPGTSSAGRGSSDPPLVRATAAGYEVLAGFEAWEAARKAGADRIDCWLYSGGDTDALITAIQENERRGALGLMDKARAVQRLVRTHRIRQRAVGEALGLSQATVSNLVRIVERLDEGAQALVAQGSLTEGHARALLAAAKEQQEPLAREAIAHRWSVRRLEAEIKGAGQERVRSPDLDRLERELTEAVGNPVKIESHPDGTGSVEVRFHSLDEAEGIIARLRQPPPYNPDNGEW